MPCLAKEYLDDELGSKITLPEEWVLVPNPSKAHEVMFIHYNKGYDSYLIIKSSLNRTESTLDSLSDQEIKDIAYSNFEYLKDNPKSLIENKVIQVYGHKALFFITESTLNNNTPFNRIFSQFTLNDGIYTVSVVTGSSTYDEVLPEIMEMLNTFQPLERKR